MEFILESISLLTTSVISKVRSQTKTLNWKCCVDGVSLAGSVGGSGGVQFFFWKKKENKTYITNLHVHFNEKQFLLLKQPIMILKSGAYTKTVWSISILICCCALPDLTHRLL